MKAMKNLPGAEHVEIHETLCTCREPHEARSFRGAVHDHQLRAPGENVVRDRSIPRTAVDELGDGPIRAHGDRDPA